MSYDAQAASALRLLARRGVALPITAATAGTRDPVAQSSTGGGTATQTVSVLILPATVSRDMTMDELTLVRKNQRQLYLAARKPDGSALDFPIADEQTIRFENATWRLAGVSALAPDNGSPVLYTADARR